MATSSGSSDLLRSEPSLRRVATDASIDGEAKAGLVAAIFAGKVRPRRSRSSSRAVVGRAGRSRRDLGDALEHLGEVAVVRSTGSDSGRLADELFAFGQARQRQPGAA